MQKYEGLFIADASLSMGGQPGEAAGDTDAENTTQETVETLIQGILEKADAKIEDTVAWGNRRFAYPINKQNRGNYYLVYFEAPSEKIKDINRQVSLNEKVIRVMITADDKREKKGQFEKILQQAQ